MSKRVQGLIRELQRLLKEHGNLKVTYSVPGHTVYQDRPIRKVALVEQGLDGHMKTVDIS